MTTPSRSIEEARSVSLEYGWNSACYPFLKEGINHWWSSDRRALVGFVRSGRMAIVAGVLKAIATAQLRFGHLLAASLQGKAPTWSQR